VKLFLVTDKKLERDQRIEANVGLVPPIARGILRRLPPSFELDDLISEGYVGLINAADTYRADSPMDFEGYAAYQIRFAILTSVRRRNYVAATMEPIFTKRAGHNHAAAGGEDEEVLRTEVEERYVDADVEAELIAMLDEGTHRTTLREVISLAPDRIRRVLEIYYQEQGAIQDAGAELGVHPSRASQIHHDGLREVASGMRRRGVVIGYAELRAAVLGKRAA
jgi:RNA polymerase sigma factor for flagellar operon FliA